MNWWFWSAWIETPQELPTTLYAFAAKTQAVAVPQGNLELKLPSGAKLVKAESLLSEEAGNRWLEQLDNASEIALREILPGSPNIDVMSPRDVLIDAFGQSSVTVRHYVGQVAANTYMGQVPDTLQALDYRAQELGLNFRGSSAGHLGGFDLFEMQPPFDGVAMFGCNVIKDDGRVMLRLSRKLPDCELSVAVCMRSLGETLAQRLVSWPQGDAILDLDLGPTVDGTRVDVYEVPSGGLIYREECNFVMETQISMGIGGRTLHHKDALVQRAASLSVQDRRRAIQTTTQSKQLTRVGGTSVRTQVQQLQHAVKEMTSLSADRWFARGVSEELDVIDHINSLLGDAGACQKFCV